MRVYADLQGAAWHAGGDVAVDQTEPILGKIRRRPILGGLINQYEAAA